MLSIRANERRDISLDARGNLALASGMDAITQNCITAMSAQLGEMILAADEGIPTLAAAWDKYHPVAFESAARRTLSRVEGVVDVVDFQSRRDGDVLRYFARILTTYGIVELSA